MAFIVSLRGYNREEQATAATDTVGAAPTFDIASAVYGQRIEMASVELRKRLIERAADLRDAFATGLAQNPRILEIAADLERLADTDRSRTPV